jgi:hypothetical protein
MVCSKQTFGGAKKLVMEIEKEFDRVKGKLQSELRG